MRLVPYDRDSWGAQSKGHRGQCGQACCPRPAVYQTAGTPRRCALCRKCAARLYPEAVEELICDRSQ